MDLLAMFLTWLVQAFEWYEYPVLLFGLRDNSITEGLNQVEENKCGV